MSDTLPAKTGQWAPGQSGNPNGRPKGRKNHLVELKRELEIAVRDNLDPKSIREILVVMTAQAMAGDVRAAKLILDKVLSNAGEGEETQEAGNTFVFQVKNLTLKHPALEGRSTEIIDVTPQEIIEVSTGAVESNQARPQDTSGGNLVGKNPDPVDARKVPAFQGKSGQPDNQSTSRPVGSV
jgi:hypothetical protein